MIARGTGFVRGNQVKARARLVAHVRYLLSRARQAEEQEGPSQLFSQSADALASKDAVEQIMAHTSARVRYHKFILSPGDGEAIRDWQEWTREVLRDLEQRLGSTLYWYAVHHTNTAHPHVHIILAGSGTPIGEGKPQPLRMQVADYQFLRQQAALHSEAAWQQQITSLATQLDQEDMLVQMSKETRSLEQPVGALLPGEGQVGVYRQQSRQGERGDQLTPHHMPASAVLKRYGIQREDGITLTMEQPRVAGRHRLTRTFGVQADKLQETPREALARDVRNVRAIYESQGQLTPQIQTALREVVQQNKERYPTLFQKEAQS